MSAELRRSASGQPPVVVQVWGPGALFTRPEFRVERLTYPVMTPTAAIGVLESIFWKPEFSWDPVAIEVLRDIRQFTLRDWEVAHAVLRQSHRMEPRRQLAQHVGDPLIRAAPPAVRRGGDDGGRAPHRGPSGQARCARARRRWSGNSRAVASAGASVSWH